ncbi:MAG: TonB-dependent receptor plug domain-containing protein [Marinagarivorans sp.]|nr:TonB-dependent receptor plug domain-containing protein [Marinagarivorans sp.]
MQSHVFKISLLALAVSLTTFSATSAFAQDNQQNVKKLNTVKVEADSIEEELYTAKQASTSTKLDLSIKETPQSITVITRKQIDDMGVTNLGQLLTQTTGVILTGDNSERTNFSIRGFNVGDAWNSNLMQYDGIPINASNVASSKPDTAMIESVQIFAGCCRIAAGIGRTIRCY